MYIHIVFNLKIPEIKRSKNVTNKLIKKLFFKPISINIYTQYERRSNKKASQGWVLRSILFCYTFSILSNITKDCKCTLSFLLDEIYQKWLF